MKIPASFTEESKVSQVVLVASLALLAYLPSLFIGFLSDDYLIIYQGIHGEENDQFFRPGSLWLNHAWFGKSAVAYHIINVLLHMLSSVAVYVLSGLISSHYFQGQKKIALITAILFAVYPYHTESVAWISGAASLGAGLFLFLCLYFLIKYLSAERTYMSFTLSLIGFFIALFFYESSWCFLILPIMFLFFCKKEERIFLLYWYVGIWLFFSFYLLIKWHCIDTIWGVYGRQAHFRLDVLEMLQNYFKFFIRALIPPMANKFLYISLFLLAVLFIVQRLFQISKHCKRMIWWILFIVVAFMISLLPVVNLSISSFTNESDRFMYFPSVWICLFLATLLCFNQSRSLFYSILIFSLTYIGYCQFKMYWVSEACRGMTKAIVKELNGEQKILVEDCPGTIEGIYAFRHGLEQSLWFENENIKVSNVVVKNVIDYEDIPLMEATTQTDSIMIRFALPK